jgi:hypothetical protein
MTGRGPVGQSSVIGHSSSIVEQLCYRCGAHMDEGVAFCPACGAPQIRVLGMPEEPAPPPASPEAQPAPYGSPPPPVRVEWSQALPGAALAGLAVAVGWIVPFASVCLWVLAGGALSVALYRRRRPDSPLTPGAGARLGTVTGLLGFLVFGFAFLLQMALLGQGGRFRQAMRQVLEESASRSSDPRSQEALEMLLSPGGMAVVVTLVAVVFLAAFVGFGALGGALGAVLFSKNRSR